MTVARRNVARHGSRVPWLGLCLLAPSAFASAQAPPACTAAPNAPTLDHAIVVVRDLDSAWARFGPLGFRYKAGRLHADSLLNRHIKFRDKTEIELMTLAGQPTSRMARGYADLLSSGEKGVYVALWTTVPERDKLEAERLGLAVRSTVLGPWEFIAFPGLPGGSAVFFGAGGVAPVDPDSVLDHSNGAVALEAAWVEAPPELERLITALGAARCEPVSIPDGRPGTRWALGRGALVIVAPGAGATPRLLGVELGRGGPRGRAGLLKEPLQGFWILFR